ncbi:putative aminocyclopropanecarboxylate oxidase [Helianthus annuus]|nr:putative aminocyclopropanecarboxylate oxidase [Helianthus annuus]KAJ0586107.1 putative aminocyclopropanecarboxylate oxidase [Helianthus annuus]
MESLGVLLSLSQLSNPSRNAVVGWPAFLGSHGIQDGDNCSFTNRNREGTEAMTEYRAELKKLAEKLMEVMDENLGIAKGHIKKMFNDGDEENAFFGTKVSHYPPCPHPERVTGLRAHTDAGGVILLFQDDEDGGLEILKDGKWTDAVPNGTRRSIASFYNPSYNATIEPASQLIQKENKDVNHFGYRKFVFGDYMSVYTEQKFLPKNHGLKL